MGMHHIEIDDQVWDYLKQFAEPFVDTPNTVLRRLLLEGTDAFDQDEEPLAIMNIKGVPKALSQILEVLYEIEINNCSRTEATHRVAKKRGTAPQTVIDKYCRQLNKRAHEIDQMLSEPTYTEFRQLLKEKFTSHHGIIEIYFETLIGGQAPLPDNPDLTMRELAPSLDS
ncbi:MAG: hypothetical protein AMJ54_15125 [Deltaproteobacteria bacterium SG8_13]|nr:MAG: hypothetical protein AMJ54_15125 [Deltaproteobacteria bacterium SG8_13]